VLGEGVAHGVLDALVDAHVDDVERRPLTWVKILPTYRPVTPVETSMKPVSRRISIGSPVHWGRWRPTART